MNYRLLDNINSPLDLKHLSIDDLDVLSEEIRDRIIKVLSVNGGHLSSNLGIVELTVALHKVFDSPYDKFIFDTSHQSYTHKIITGRNISFDSLRQHNGICGFSHPDESEHDHFFSGHAGATFSTALGLAKNRDLNNESYKIIPILGDASFTCGLTLEALNNIPPDLKGFIAILNDNNMAISKNVGNIKNILSRIINNPTANKLYLEMMEKLSKIPNIGNFLAQKSQKIKESIKNLFSSATFFELFGLTYIGPIDGHDIKKMVETFTALQGIQKAVIVHVITTKGKGMLAAKENPTSYHGVRPFNIENGQFLHSKKITFPQIFGDHLLEVAKKDSSIVVISPAMLEGSSLVKFKEAFPERCLDVGIAEGHCVTFAGGLAYKGKNKIVVCIYSTFLQRALDNVFHDVCLQKLPVVFAIDRAGISGPDGTTHHGIYDIGFLNSMPNMVICQPRDGKVLKELLSSSFSYNRPVAIRYPNIPTVELSTPNLPSESDPFKSISEESRPLQSNSVKDQSVRAPHPHGLSLHCPSIDLSLKDHQKPSNLRKLGKGEILKRGKDILLIPLGHHFTTAFDVAAILEAYSLNATIVDPVFLKPLDSDLLIELFSSHKYIATIEEHSLSSGLGSIINSFAIKHNFNDNQIINFGICDTFVQHGKNEELLKDLGLDPESIAKCLLNRFDLIKIKCETKV